MITKLVIGMAHRVAMRLSVRAYKYGEDSVYYDAQNGLRNFVHEFAVRLRDYGQKLLKGDLSELPAMASVIKKRAKDGRDGAGVGM